MERIVEGHEPARQPARAFAPRRHVNARVGGGESNVCIEKPGLFSISIATPPRGPIGDGVIIIIVPSAMAPLCMKRLAWTPRSILPAGMQPCRGHDIMRRSSVTAPHTHTHSLSDTDTCCGRSDRPLLQ